MRQAKWLAASAAGVLALAGLASTARADVKLEQTTTASGMAEPGAAKAKSVTTKTTVFYKGSKSRTDDDKGSTIFDAATGKMTFINPKDKTYYEMTLADMIPTTDGGMSTMVDYKGDAIVTDTKEEKQVAGKMAHHYKYVMTITMTPKASAPPALAAMLPSMEVTGDQWTVESPDAATTATKLSESNMMKSLPPGMGAALKPLTEKMATIKGLTVEQVQTMSWKLSPAAPEEMKAQIPQDPIVSTTKTVTLSEAAIPDSIFTIPAGYKKLTAPKGPQLPN